jgi:hypothetical protein
MKTDQEYRTIKMGEYEIRQRLSDGYFDAWYLIDQWNEKNPDDQKSIEDFREYLLQKN